MNTSNHPRTVAHLLLLLVPLTLGACANQAVTRSGFLDHYDTLSPTQADDPSLSYSRTNIDRRTYRNVVIEDIQIRLPAAQAKELSADLQARAKEDYRAALDRAFGKRYRLVSGAAAADALRVRAAITGLKPSSPALNSVTLVLVGPVSNGGVSTESEVVDGATGERIAAQAAFANPHLFNGGGLGGYFDRLGHIRRAFDVHAEKLVELTLPGVAASAPAVR